MKTQRAIVPETNRETWMVLDDDYLPVKPVEDFLAYCDNIERSPNTVKMYAHHLKLYWEYLQDAQLDWSSANVIDKIADFVAWLRSPAPAPFDTILVKEQEAKRQESTVNAILSAVAAFYEFHERVGDVEQPGSLYRLQVMPRQRYKSFLYHIAKSKPVLSKMVKLKEPRRLPQTLKPDQVKQLIDACQRYRDKLLITSTFAP